MNPLDGITKVAPPSLAVSTEQRVREAATILFYEKGYHGTTMRSIGEAVGIKAGSLYNHFPSKHELLRAIAQDTIRSMLDEAKSLLDGVSDPREQLRLLIEFHVEFHAVNRFAARVADEQLHALDPAAREQVVEGRDAYEQLFKDILRRGVIERRWNVEEPTIIAFAIATMCTQVDSWYREDGRLSASEVGRIYSSFVLRALRGISDEAGVRD